MQTNVASLWHHLSWVPRTAVLTAIVAYQACIRPLLGGSCIYFPSCSDYAAEAVRTHGVWGGGRLALRRLLRCHPFATGGIDPVPPAPSKGS